MENSLWKGQWTCRKAKNRKKNADFKGTEYECVASTYLAKERGQVTNSSVYTNESSDTIKCWEFVDYRGDTSFLRSTLLHVAIIVHTFLSQLSPAEVAS